MEIKSNILFILGLALILVSIFQILNNATALTTENILSTKTVSLIIPTIQIFLGLGLCILSLFFSKGEQELEAEVGLKTWKLKKGGK